jgi:uncharacterized protein (DUF58 family)
MVPLLFASLAEARAPKPCWVPSRLSYTGRDTLAYLPQPEAQAREDEAARVERRQPREIRAGWLSLELNRVTLAAADPGLQQVTVLRDGQELLRYEAPSDVTAPEENPQIVGYWFSYVVVQLPEGLAPPFDVEVADRLLTARCAWTVDESGEARLLPRE